MGGCVQIEQDRPESKVDIPQYLFPQIRAKTEVGRGKGEKKILGT